MLFHVLNFCRQRKRYSWYVCFQGQRENIIVINFNQEQILLYDKSSQCFQKIIKQGRGLDIPTGGNSEKFSSPLFFKTIIILLRFQEFLINIHIKIYHQKLYSIRKAGHSQQLRQGHIIKFKNIKIKNIRAQAFFILEKSVFFLNHVFIFPFTLL